MSDAWDVENGIGHGAVVSGCFVQCFIEWFGCLNYRRVCSSVACTVQILLYADDVVILSDDPLAFQCALDAVAAWAQSSRFNFAVGPNKPM